jgi:TonB family protein
MAVVAVGIGCAKPPAATERPQAIPVDVVADSGRGGTLRIVAPDAPPARASVWLARVSPARSTPPLPTAEATPETLPGSFSAPPALAIDEGLKPPLPRSRAPLAVPKGAQGLVELDVRVDEQGRVTDALWAGGSADSTLVRAATACARNMRFYPALRAGRAVAVWCRQQFVFGTD